MTMIHQCDACGYQGLVVELADRFVRGLFRAASEHTARRGSLSDLRKGGRDRCGPLLRLRKLA